MTTSSTPIAPLAQRSETADGESSAPPFTGVEPIQAWTSSATPSSAQKMLNLCRPSSKTSGPPPFCSMSKRQAAARSGTSQPQSGSPERLDLAYRKDLADLTFAHQLHEAHYRRVEEEVLEDAHDLAPSLGRLRGLHETGALGHREAHRLLGREVLARLDDRQRDLEMHVVGEEHLEGVDGVVGQALLPVGIDLLRLDAPRPCTCQRALGVGFADRRDLGVAAS